MHLLETVSERLSVAYRHVRAQLAFQYPNVPNSPYINPPPLVRYTLERWTSADQLENEYAGETYAPTYCDACIGMQGDYKLDEWYVNDTLSCDTFHSRCVPWHTRARALAGILLCTLHAVLGIDSRRTHQL